MSERQERNLVESIVAQPDTVMSKELQRKMVAKDRLTESDFVMWRNFEPQTQNGKREKQCSNSCAIGPKPVGETGNQFAYIFQLIGLVNGQQTLERIVLAARPVRLRKEGPGIRVIPNTDPMSKDLPHHLC